LPPKAGGHWFDQSGRNQIKKGPALAGAFLFDGVRLQTKNKRSDKSRKRFVRSASDWGKDQESPSDSQAKSASAQNAPALSETSLQTSSRQAFHILTSKTQITRIKPRKSLCLRMLFTLFHLTPIP